jgi:predicted RNase H-like HicB family nuclease
MKKATYFAVFEPTATGYSVYFPDLPGCITVGKDMEQASKMAKEALGLHLWGMEKDNEVIPNATLPPFEDINASDFVMPIEIFPELVKNEIESKAVKKTLTIPY